MLKFKKILSFLSLIIAAIGITGCSDNDPHFILPPLESPVLIINSLSKKCLSLAEGARAEPVQANCTNLVENLIITKAEQGPGRLNDDVYIIKNPSKNLCLEMPESASLGTNARFAPCTDERKQFIKFMPSLRDWRFLKIKFAHNEHCLEDQGDGTFTQKSCHEENSQDFLISLPKENKSALPRIIWTFWDKGEAALPGFYQANLERWNRKLNKAGGEKWEIKVINLIEGDPNYYGNYVEKSSLLDLASLKAKIGNASFEKRLNPVVIFSDFVRLELLHKYGGIWMDPSIMLHGNLAEIVSLLESADKFKLAGFTTRPQASFKWRYADSLENFIIFALPNSELIKAWKINFRQYWDHKKANMGLQENPLYANMGLDVSTFVSPFYPLADYLNQHLALKYTLIKQPKLLDEIYVLGGTSIEEKGAFSLLQLTQFGRQGSLVNLSSSQIDEVFKNMNKVLISKFPSYTSVDFINKDKQYFFDTGNIFGRLNSLP
jgi:hypothetical protein